MNRPPSDQLFDESKLMPTQEKAFERVAKQLAQKQQNKDNEEEMSEVSEGAL